MSVFLNYSLFQTLTSRKACLLHTSSSRRPFQNGHRRSFEFRLCIAPNHGCVIAAFGAEASDSDSDSDSVCDDQVQRRLNNSPVDIAPDTPHMTDANSPGIQIYENQRWFGFPLGWRPPVAVLDYPAWTEVNNDDKNGKPVATNEMPNGELEWELVIGPDTDPEGWQYGTVFGHLNNKRAGGRASRRFGDAVRRRRWHKTCSTKISTPLNNNNNNNNNNNDDTEDDKKKKTKPPIADAAKKREGQAKAKAIRAFSGMILDLLSRRKLWTLVPWDPSAFYFMFKAHMEVYQELRRQAMSRRLFSSPVSSDDPQSGTPSPPSILHSSDLDGGGTLLQDLLIAATHSRAAYGFAMQAGHISSISSYIKLQTVQPLTFDAVAGASVEANNEAVAALTGIPVDNILMSHWRNSPFRPCHYVAIDDAARCIVLSVRGSLEVGDWLSDLSAHPMEVYLAGQQGWVHQGILAAATYIHCTTSAALIEASRRRPGWPLLLTGHSLGGGVAALLATLLKEEGVEVEGKGTAHPALGQIRIRAITIGPAAVMSESLAKACESTTVSVILGSDVVPHLSYASVENLLLEMSQCSPVRRVAEGISKTVGQALGGGLWGLSTRSEESTKKATQIPVLDLSTMPPEEVQQNVKENKEPAKDKAVPIIQEESEDVSSPYSVPCINQPDLGLMGGAMAQEGSRNSDRNGDFTHAKGSELEAPEHLYPPGRLVWVFPGDEDTSDLGGNGNGNVTGAEKNADWFDASWSSIWEGEKRQIGMDEKKGVNIAEAEATVATQKRRNALQKKTVESTDSGSDRPPVLVAEADRRAFERLLLMPDMLQDHLPDRYLEALQQL